MAGAGRHSAFCRGPFRSGCPQAPINPNSVSQAGKACGPAQPLWLAAFDEWQVALTIIFHGRLRRLPPLAGFMGFTKHSSLGAAFLVMLMMLMPSASAGPAKAARLMPIGTEDPQAAPQFYRCHGYHGRVSPWISAGSTGGWPYFGWPGYPYLPSLPPAGGCTAFIAILPPGRAAPAAVEPAAETEDLGGLHLHSGTPQP